MIILEGTDAVGKTSVINSLKEYNIKDRDSYISSLMNFDISLKTRSNKLNEYLKNINDYVIFLINNDSNELERRVNSRSVIDEYDRLTYLYNILYFETFLYMKYNNLLENKLYMIDCTNLSIKEESEKVKELIIKKG